ncbi:hypothetical protein B566_EDAN002147, partial [Ephemera danica]
MKLIFLLLCLLVCLFQQSGGTDTSHETNYDYDMGPDVPLIIDDIVTVEVSDERNHDATTDNNLKYFTANYETTETTSESRDNNSGYTLELTTEKSNISEPENDKSYQCECSKNELEDARDYQKKLHIILNNKNMSLIKANSELEICKKKENESKNELEFVKSQRDFISAELQTTQQTLTIAIIDLESEKERSFNIISSLKKTFNISEAQNALKLRHFMTLSSENRLRFERSQEEKRQIDAKFKILQQQYEKLVAEKDIIDQNLKDSAIQLKTCMDSEKAMINDLNNTKFMLEEALIKEIDMALTIENLIANRDNLNNELDKITANFFEKEEELRVCLSRNHNYSLQAILSLNKENELLNRLKTTEAQNKLSENNLQITQNQLKECEDQIQSNEALLNQTQFEIKSYMNDNVEDTDAWDETDFLNYTVLLTKKLATELNLSVSREQNLSAQIENVTQQYFKAAEELEVNSQREESLNLKLKIALQSEDSTKKKLESSVQEITNLEIELNQTAQQKSIIQSVLEENKKKLTKISARLTNTVQLLNTTKLELLKSKQIEKTMKEKMSSIITSKRNETKELRIYKVQSERLQSYLTNALQYWNKTEQNLIVAKEKIENMDKRMKAAQQACRDKNLSIDALNRQIKQTRAEITSCRSQVNGLNNQLNDRNNVISDETHSTLRGSKLHSSTSNSEPTSSTTAAEKHLICESKIQDMTSKLKTDLDFCTANASQMRSEKLRISHILLDKSMELDMCIPKKKSNGRNDIYKPARIFSGTYYFNPKRLDWWMARDFCRDRGMDLVSIETAEENERLKEYIHKIITHNGSRSDNEWRLSKPDIAWTSGCYTNEGWLWNTTGNAVTFSNWREPIT